jgi:hypothetical protein
LVGRVDARKIGIDKTSPGDFLQKSFQIRQIAKQLKKRQAQGAGKTPVSSIEKEQYKASNATICQC